MSSSRQRYSSIPRDGPCKNFSRLGKCNWYQYFRTFFQQTIIIIPEPGTSSLRCGVVSALTTRSDPQHFKTLPTRRNLERLNLSSIVPIVTSVSPADIVDGNYHSHHQYPQYASRMSRFVNFCLKMSIII